MDDLVKQYEWTRSWFEYTNGQAYGANGWAIAAAFAIFLYVLKDASDRLTVCCGTAAAILLVVFVGVTAAGWAIERDAAYRNIVQLEAAHRAILSQDPTREPQSHRIGNFGSWPLAHTIDGLTIAIALGFLSGGFVRLRGLAPQASTPHPRSDVGVVPNVQTPEQVD